MADEHWIDVLSKVLSHATPRRAVLGAAMVVASAACGRPLAAAAKKGKRKNKKKRKKPDTRRPAPSCSGGACAREWAGDRAEIDHCEFICEQCGGDDPRDFCIVQRASGPVADCCDIEEQCCGDRCCDGYCCDLGAGRGKHCVIDAMACCPDDFASGVCDRGTQKCCAGYGCQYRTEDCPDDDCGGLCTRLGLTCCHGACFDTTVDTDHCGRCDRECTGRLNDCCEGDCVDVETDLTHCGGCNRPCTGTNRRCCDGKCVDITTPANCGRCGPCPAPYTCCDGRCVDTDWNHDHCGACGAACQPGEFCCHGRGRGCIDSCGGFCTC